MIKSYDINYYKTLLDIAGHTDYKEEELIKAITPDCQLVMNTKCIVFARVSTPQQDLDQQTNSLVTSAKALGYSDENIIVIKMKESGISLSEEERQGISELKNAILLNKDVDTVLCWEISRIARRADIIFSIRDFFKTNHIRWITMTPYIELIDKDGHDNQTTSLLLAVLTSFAESEMNLKKERAKRVVEYRKSLGKFAGGKILFGYKVDENKNFIKDDKEYPLLLKIFNMYSTGEYSLRSLSKELKSQGYFENSSLHSLPSRIGFYIKDERYIGKVFGYPQIIDEELFNKCIEILKKNLLIEKSVNKGLLLCKGLIFDKNRHVALIPSFGKGVYSIHPDYGKPCLTISCKYIDKLVSDFVQIMIDKYYSNPEQIEKDFFEHKELIFKKILSLTKETYKIQEKLNRAEELYIDGGISKEKLDKKTKQLKDDLIEKKIQITQLDNEHITLEQNYINKKPVVFNDLKFDEKRKYLKDIISKIEIEKEKPLARRSTVYIHCKTDHNIYVYLLYSQNSKYPNKVKSPYLVRIEPETEM